MKLDLTVFELNVSKMSVLELADWLVSCRNQVKRENFDTDSEYYENLKIFCDKWEKHYEKNIGFYESKEFAFALMYSTVKDNAVLVTKFKGGEHRCPIGSCEDMNSITIEKTNTVYEIENLMLDMYAEMLKIFDEKLFKEKPFDKYKKYLHDYLVKYRFTEIIINRYIKGEYFNKTPVTSYNELEVLVEQHKHYLYMKRAHKKTNYTNGLKQYDITKSVYSYFCSDDKCEKDFTKKMFVNLGFLLGLSLKHLEKLLELNGYSISEYSQRKFDQIIRRTFKCGFSRDMAIGLIAIEKSKGYNVPNLTKNNKEK